MELLKNDFARLQQRSLIRWQGKGTEAAGQTIESEGRPARWGNVCELEEVERAFFDGSGPQPGPRRTRRGRRQLERRDEWSSWRTILRGRGL